MNSTGRPEASATRRRVAKASGDKVAEYKNLKDMWTKVRDKDAFIEYVQSNIKAYQK